MKEEVRAGGTGRLRIEGNAQVLVGENEALEHHGRLKRSGGGRENAPACTALEDTSKTENVVAVTPAIVTRQGYGRAPGGARDFVAGRREHHSHAFASERRCAGGADGTSATVLVGGATAAFSDIGDRILERLPYLLIAVIGLSFILLMAVFRSVVVALKAAI